MPYIASLIAISTIVPVLPPLGGPETTTSSSVAPAACAAYAIDGALEPPSNGEWEFTATAYLHDGSEALPNHRVYAVPTMTAGSPPVDPIELVTDAEGRASITLPVGAEGVRFMSESPDSQNCQGPREVVAVEVEAPLGRIGELPVTGVPGWLVTAALVPAAAGLGIMVGRGRHRRPTRNVRPTG
jgi:hypothetical protein